VTAPAEWNSRARCRGAEVEIFYPPAGDSDSYRQVRQVYCDRCEVRAECLAFALASEPRDRTHRHGLFGGLSPVQRHDPALVAAVLAGGALPGRELERVA
jgi:hypothetical protein